MDFYKQFLLNKEYPERKNSWPREIKSKKDDSTRYTKY